MHKKHIIFLVNLLQDVNIVRPLALLAARKLDVQVEFLVTYRFLQRDKTRTWQKEIALICQNTAANVYIYSNGYEALQSLAGKSGIIVAASESSLSAHSDTHEVFQLAPKGFLKITLQHGFECVGFLQNREHDKAHGRQVIFAADVVCGWFGARKMTSMVASQRSKLYVSGPPSVLQERVGSKKPGFGGLVCENLHSVRMHASGDFKADFMSVFAEYCEAMAQKKQKVFLRPHPGGQYVIKNNIQVQKNVVLQNEPIYKLKLNQFDYGISASSSILIDLILAGVPVAVWGDNNSIMDTSNYSGLMHISSVNDWVNFADRAMKKPQLILAQQARFIDSLEMPVNRDDVENRFLRLLAGGSIQTVTVDTTMRRQEKARILFVAMDEIPTYQLSFVKPLKPLLENGDVLIKFINEETLYKVAKDANTYINQVFDEFKPDLLVFCRYSGPGHETLLKVARQRGCPTIYHVDDDLLNIPPEIGEKKYLSYNRPDRLESVNSLIENVDLVYCSTPALKSRYQSYGFKTDMISGQIYCSAEVRRKPLRHPMQKLGYMGFDHSHDLELILPALVTFLERHEDIIFELFGSIPKPAALDKFGDRIRLIKPIRDYTQFMERFSELGWDVGLCPLQKTPFNAVKANTKWVEYTSIGAAVIASAGLMYDDCCQDDCGILAQSEDDWLLALETFYSDTDFRVDSVLRAQQRLKTGFSESDLRQQVLKIFSDAKNKKTGSPFNWPEEPPLQVQFQPKRFERILVAADALSATQEISFRRPLTSHIEAGEVTLTMIPDGPDLRDKSACRELWDAVQPTVVFLSRFGDALETHLYELAREKYVPVIFHLDDNLLRVSRQLGYGKFKFYNQAARKKSLRDAINASDLLFASTATLGNEIAKEGVVVPIVAGDIYCSIDPHQIATFKPAATPVIGYMGTGGHAADVASILPAIVRIMNDNPSLRFETFGTIEPDPRLVEFGSRFKHHRRAASYQDFLSRMGRLGWWAGLAPLENHDFNLCKADTKWVEYSLSGMPVIASNLSVYSRACSGDSGLLADDEDDWYRAIHRILHEKPLKKHLINNAQTKLKNHYSHAVLSAQLFRIIDSARKALT